VRILGRRPNPGTVGSGRKSAAPAVWAACALFAAPLLPVSRVAEPGLELTLRSVDTGAVDVRVARLAALHVPQGQPASPFFDAGPFEATFRGAILLDLNDSFRFTVRGTGAVRLSVHGEIVLEEGTLAGAGPVTTPDEIRLRKGPNEIEIVYRSPGRGDATFRLTWSNDYLPEEPLPPQSLLHVISPEVRQDRQRRQQSDDPGALLSRVPAEYAEHVLRTAGCLGCHARDGTPATGTSAPKQGGPSRSWSQPDRTEWFAQNPSEAEDSGPALLPPDLTWAGEKLRSDWLASWLGGRIDDRPRPHLEAPRPHFEGDAELFAIGLRHQHGLPAGPGGVEPPDAALAAVGRDLIRAERLGCHSCHALGGEPALGGEGSEETINFALARRRLHRAYFDRFLLNPERLLPGTKMPSFVDEDGYTALYDVFDGEAKRQFDAIWHYLGTLD